MLLSALWAFKMHFPESDPALMGPHGRGYCLSARWASSNGKRHLRIRSTGKRRRQSSLRLRVPLHEPVALTRTLAGAAGSWKRRKYPIGMCSSRRVDRWGRACWRFVRRQTRSTRFKREAWRSHSKHEIRNSKQIRDPKALNPKPR